MSLRLPYFENHAAALQVSSVISILAHGVLLGALAWTFPYPTPLPPKDEGITIELEQLMPPQPEEKVVEPSPPVAEAQPQKEPPPSEPEPEPQKIEKPKPVKPKAAPPKSQPSKPAVKTVATATPTPAVKADVAPAKPATPSAPVKDPTNPRPVYPDLARKRNQEGIARIRCQVNAGGMVTDASLAQSSGHKLLDEAALKTVRKWRFKPAMSNGTAVGGTVVVPVEFRLR